MQSRDVGNLLPFLVIAEEGSMNRAARVLHTSQPALTRMVQELEAAIGEQVFERHARGVRPTPVGEILVRHARAIRAEANAALYEVDRFRRDGRRHIKIGASPYHPLNYLSRALADVVTQNPDLDLHLQYGSPQEILELLRGGGVEMVIGPLLAGEAAEGHLQEVLFYDELVIACRANHRLARRQRVDVQQLLAESWVLGPPDSLMRTRVDALFRNDGLEPPRIQLEVDDVATRRALVVHSDFLSAFQRNQVEAELEAGLAACIDFQWPQARRAIGVVRVTPHNELSAYITSVLKRFYRTAGERPPVVAHPGEPLRGRLGSGVRAGSTSDRETLRSPMPAR